MLRNNDYHKIESILKIEMGNIVLFLVDEILLNQLFMGESF